MRQHTRRPFFATAALIALLALALVPSAAHARSCGNRAYDDPQGQRYTFLYTSVRGAGCAQARALFKSIADRRSVQKGARALGYRCRYVEEGDLVSSEPHHTCRKGGVRVVFTLSVRRSGR